MVRLADARVRRSLGYAAAGTLFALPLQLLSTAILSRLLTPAELGAFAIAAVLVAFAGVFRDFGVGEYLIQEPQLDSARIRSAMGLNLLISWGVALLLVLAAPLVAGFYRDGSVATVMRIQAMNFVLIPFGAIAQACQRRQLQFRPIFVSAVAAGLVSFAVSIVLALRGLGPTSLAWGSLAGAATSAVVSVALSPPGFPFWPSFRGLGPVWRFGRLASGVYLFGQVGRSAPDLLIGRLHDLAGVALFSRASGLVELFNRLVMGVVMPVCLPYLAERNRRTASAAEGYLRASSLITGAGWPFFAFLAVHTQAALLLVYGSQWLSVVPVARVMCLVGALELLHVLAKELLIAVGQVQRASALQVQTILLRVAGLLLVVTQGLMGAAIGLALGALTGVWLSQRTLGRHAGIGVHATLQAHRGAAALAAVVAGPQLLLLWVAPAGGAAAVLFLPVAALTGVASWLLGLWWLKHPLRDELRRLLPRRAQAAAGGSSA